MRLTELLIRGGKQLIIAGGVALLIGWLVVILQAVLTQQALPFDQVIMVGLLCIGLIGGIHLYQRSIFWKRLHKQLQAASVQHELPTTRYPQLPLWGWIVWAVVMFMLAYGFTPIFAILSGSLLVGYASAGSWLARQVSALEAGRVVFYTVQDQKTHRASLVRVINDDHLVD